MTETTPASQPSSLMVRVASTKKVSREQIERIIAENQRIADITFLRTALLKQIARMSETVGLSPAALQIQNRDAHLRPFQAFFRRLLDPRTASPRLRSFSKNVQLVASCGWNVSAFRSLPSVFDRQFSDPEDLIEPLFAALFGERDALPLHEWMRTLDAHVETVSRRLVEAMDQAARTHQKPLRKEVVLVGGGPLTSIVASILGAFFHITVITEQRGLGKPWRHRPISINSSSAVSDWNAAPLPLLEGGTTRISGRQQLNSLGIELLLGAETKTVCCEDGTVAEYGAGPRLGELVATNILLHVDDYLIKQRVDVSRIERTTEGTLRLVLVDTEDGTQRELDAAAVFLLTGPGKEQSKVSAATVARAGQAAQRLETRLDAARKALAWHGEAFGKLEPLAAQPGVMAQRQWLDERIAQTRVVLPAVLTLTAIEQLYEWWEELGAHPANFPLRDLITQSNTVAYLGNGDTMRTLKELVEGRGPACAYPAGVKPEPRTSTIYNEVATSPLAYDRANRRRYQGIYTPGTRTIPTKATQYRVLSEGTGVEVTHRERDGARRRRRYRYVFDCTGLDRRPIAAQLAPTLSVQAIRDLQGAVVATGNKEANLFIVGSAASMSASELPDELQTIFRTLGIAENSISLWVNGLLAERLAYTFAATHPHTKGKRSEQGKRKN